MTKHRLNFVFCNMYIMNRNKCQREYHFNIEYCGGCCVMHYNAYNQTSKLCESEYSKNPMIVSSSYWTGYDDAITYQ
jgi:hypothetical protein